MLSVMRLLSLVVLSAAAGGVAAGSGSGRADFWQA